MTQLPETTLQQPEGLPRAIRGRAVRRLVAATALLLLTITLLPRGGTVAHAHASLIASDPVSGAFIAAAPETLRLTFNEDVTLLETTRLTGPGGGTAYTAEVDGGLVELRPAETLGNGRWDLVWQIVSADGHLVGGVITFTIGETGADDGAITGSSAATAYSPGNTTENDNGTATGSQGPGALDRVLELLGWLTLIGALGALIAGRLTPGAWLGAGAVLVPTLRVVDSLDRWGKSAWIIGETRASIAAALAGLLLLGAMTAAGPVRTSLTTAAILAWSAQALFSGHPNTLDPEPLYALLSALHLAGALTWSAAVTAVLLDTGRARHASRIATVGITLLLPGALLLVGAFLPAAIENGAGRWEVILAAKAVLVLGALLLGWRNHRTCRCETCRRTGCACPLEVTTRQSLRHRTAIEIGLIAIVAVLSAILTASIPARIAGTETARTAETTGASSAATTTSTVGTQENDTSAAAPADILDGRTQVNADLLFENGETGELLLEIDPDGSTTIHLVLRDELGNPFTGEQVEYELENVEAGLSGIGGTLPVSGGMHMGETTLPSGGTWRISVNATYDTFTTITAVTEIQTPESGR